MNAIQGRGETFPLPAAFPGVSGSIQETLPRRNEGQNRYHTTTSTSSSFTFSTDSSAAAAATTAPSPPCHIRGMWSTWNRETIGMFRW
ncbi:hypothetical protein E2C01_067708 [Portunus trituberculatus]|uniref:Uncharacterized protein n=1 Tax=Portunus trituberculatus TaxID=210409 RepID=A0A5B7HKI8_PORTR|nr:hypothetical protein [Portunus trituberculatus]